MSERYNIRSRKTGKWLAYFTYMDSIWYWTASRDLKNKPTVRLVELGAGEDLGKHLQKNPEYEAVLIEGKVMKTKSTRDWKRDFLKKLDTMDVWKAVEELRLRRITLSISSVEPFDPKANYCEPFDHDEKYQVQFWDEEDQEFQEAFYGRTPAEAFRKAAKDVLK